MTHFGYRILDAVCYAWILILLALLFRNCAFELLYLPKKDPKPVIRWLNRLGVLQMALLLILSPDWMTVNEIYSSFSFVSNLCYVYSAAVLLCSSSVYFYFTLEAAQLATTTKNFSDIRQILGAIRFVKVIYCVTDVIALIICTVCTILSCEYKNRRYTAAWLIYLNIAVVIKISGFIYASIKLRKALSGLTDSQFVSLDRKLRTIQLTLLPSVLAALIGIPVVTASYFDDPAEIQDPDAFNFKLSIFMWVVLALRSVFQYASWLPSKQALLDASPKSAAPKKPGHSAKPSSVPHHSRTHTELERALTFHDSSSQSHMAPGHGPEATDLV